MEHDYQLVDITNLKKGVAIEMVEKEFEKVFKNIQNLNTSAKKTRSVSLRINFKPAEDRRTVAVNISVDSTLAKDTEDQGTIIFVANEKGKNVAYENNAEQLEIPGIKNISEGKQ